MFFNGVEVKRVSEHKHLGLVFDPKLNFAAHFKEKAANARKGIGLIKHIRSYLPTNSLDQIYKMHIRSPLDYCDFIYHIPKIMRKSKQDDVDDDTDDSCDGYDDNDDSEDNNPVRNLNTRMRALDSLQY